MVIRRPRLNRKMILTDCILLKFEIGDQEDANLLSAGEFPFIETSVRPISEGEPVYSYGYPLTVTGRDEKGEIFTHWSPRATSAIVSALIHGVSGYGGREIYAYVLDKPLNPGNSGGPVIATETGYAFAQCTSYQKLIIPQRIEKLGLSFPVELPSLDGYATSLFTLESIDWLLGDARISIHQG